MAGELDGRALAFVAEHPGASTDEVRGHLGLFDFQARNLLARLRNKGRLRSKRCRERTPFFGRVRFHNIWFVR